MEFLTFIVIFLLSRMLFPMKVFKTISCFPFFLYKSPNFIIEMFLRLEKLVLCINEFDTE